MAYISILKIIMKFYLKKMFFCVASASFVFRHTQDTLLETQINIGTVFLSVLDKYCYKSQAQVVFS